MMKLMLLSLMIALSEATTSVRKLKSGLEIRGVEIELDGSYYTAFRSIPYAEAPIGKLRFKPPVPYDEGRRINEVIEATKPAPICPQINPLNGTFLGREDCLYLNVYVPKINEKSLKPVMVFIHGGGFLINSGTMYGPEHFMESGEVILVTFNYRLGPLGFMSLEDENVIAGNMGLKDQVLALKWVKNNVETFGGDPDSITIFGCSAGGMSVVHHLIIPESNGLFARAISQSGPVSHAPFLRRSQNPSFYAWTFAQELGCVPEDKPEKTLECLQGISVEEITEKARMFEKFLYIPSPWVPAVDSEYSKTPFLPKSAAEAVREGKFNSFSSLILGGQRDEGGLMMGQFFVKDEFEDVNADFDLLGPVLLLAVDPSDVSEEDSATAHLIRLNYLDGKDSNFTEANSEKIKTMLSDVYFLGPVHEDVQHFSSAGSAGSDLRVYYYNFRYRGTHSQVEGFDFGVSHGDELIYLFHLNGKELTSEEDKRMSRKLIEFWTNFAKTGVPTREWEPVTKGESDFVVLDLDPPRRAPDVNDFCKRMKFMSSMNSVIDGYRSFDIEKHPAVVNLLKDKEAEIIEEQEDEEQAQHNRDEL